MLLADCVQLYPLNIVKAWKHEEKNCTVYDYLHTCTIAYVETIYKQLEIANTNTLKVSHSK